MTSEAALAGPSETISAVDVNKLPVGPPAPELHARGWLNSQALSPGELAGKVVVHDFWTYSCVNCVRTLPYLRAWHERYQKDGLVIVGLHSPRIRYFHAGEGNYTETEDVIRSLLGLVSPEASLSLRYLAGEVNLVMAIATPGAATIDVLVELDGKPVPEGYRTADTKVAPDGTTYVRVQAADLYRLVLGPRVEEHTVRLVPRSPGLEALAYTFGA